MMTLREILVDYSSRGKAIPAFNIDSFEIYQAVENTVRELNLPCIVQLSSGEDKFIQAERLLILVKKARIDGLPIYLNMDHGSNEERLLYLAKLGFDMLHLDKSHLSFEENLPITKDFVSKVKIINPNIIIEGEFNKINLIKNGIDENSFTSPSQALEYVNSTNIDLLAVSIGNLHGVNVDQPENIKMDLLKNIHQSLPNTFLTLHGGSGIPVSQIQESFSNGIVKVNINTDLRIAFKNSMKNSYATIDSEKAYDYLSPVVDSVSAVVKNKLLDFSK